MPLDESKLFAIFGDCGIDLLRQKLYRNGEVVYIDREGRKVPVDGIPFRLMETFVLRAGEDLSFDKLRTLVWSQSEKDSSRAKIGDNTIEKHVVTLRAACGRERNDYIKKLSLIGYRFVAKPQFLSEADFHTWLSSFSGQSHTQPIESTDTSKKEIPNQVVDLTSIRTVKRSPLVIFQRLQAVGLETFHGFIEETAGCFKLLKALLLRPGNALHTQLQSELRVRDALKLLLFSALLIVTVDWASLGFARSVFVVTNLVYVVIAIGLFTLVFFSGLFLAAPHASRKDAAVGASYLAVATQLIVWTQVSLQDVAVRLLDPTCSRAGTTRCDMVGLIKDVVRNSDRPEAPGIEMAVQASVLDGPAVIPVIVIGYIGLIALITWLAIAWHALHKNFSSKPALSISLFLPTIATAFSVGWVTLSHEDWLPQRPGACSYIGTEAPTFNNFPLTYVGGAYCHGYPLLDVKKINTAEARHTEYAASQFEHDEEISVSAGDRLEARVIFHNSASGLSSEQTIRNAKIKFGIDTAGVGQHVVYGLLSADNAPTVRSRDTGKGGDRLVRSVEPTLLQFLPGSAYLCISLRHAEQLGIATNVKCEEECADCFFNIRVPLRDVVFSDGAELGNLPADPDMDFVGFAHVSIDVKYDYGGRARLICDNARDEKNQQAAKSLLVDAQRTRIALPVDIIGLCGNSFIQESKTEPSAWDVAINFASYRTTLNSLPPASSLSRPNPNAEISVAIHPVSSPFRAPLISAYGSTTLDRSALIESIGTPSEPRSENETAEYAVFDFLNQKISLDAMRMRNIILKNAHITYTGKPLDLTNVSFVNCRLEATRNENSEQLVRALLASSSIMLKIP